MIERYSTPEMKAVWTDEAKFTLWTKSLLAVIKALETDGQINQGTFEAIRNLIGFDLNRVNELDEKFHQDAQALIEAVRETLLSRGVRKEIVLLVGTKITSYDMEDPAFARMIFHAV